MVKWKGFVVQVIHLIFCYFEWISNSSEFLNLTLWMPIREWINSSRSRSYVLSHSTCDTVLKNYFKSCTYYDIATPKGKKKLEKQHTLICVCVCVNIVRWPSQYFLSNSQHWTKAKCKTFLCARLLLWMDIRMKCCFFGVSLFLCCTASAWFIRYV